MPQLVSAFAAVTVGSAASLLILPLSCPACARICPLLSHSLPFISHPQSLFPTPTAQPQSAAPQVSTAPPAANNRGPIDLVAAQGQTNLPQLQQAQPGMRCLFCFIIITNCYTHKPHTPHSHKQTHTHTCHTHTNTHRPPPRRPNHKSHHCVLSLQTHPFKFHPPWLIRPSPWHRSVGRCVSLMHVCVIQKLQKQTSACVSLCICVGLLLL